MKKKQSFIITKEWLEQQRACNEGKRWFLSQRATRLETVVKKLIVQTQFDWANWILTRIMTHEQNVRYACFSSLQSIGNFEKEFPNDKRPRQAIEAALKWANNPTKENRSSAWSAGSAAWSARSVAWSAAWSARSAWSAESAASAARSAESAAAEAAASAAWSARSAARSASAAAAARSAARSAAWSAESAAWKKILLFGLDLVLGRVLKAVLYK